MASGWGWWPERPRHADRAEVESPPLASGLFDQSPHKEAYETQRSERLRGWEGPAWRGPGALTLTLSPHRAPCIWPVIVSKVLS